MLHGEGIDEQARRSGFQIGQDELKERVARLKLRWHLSAAFSTGGIHQRGRRHFLEVDLHR
jgi:hypothetical protein